MPVCCSVPRERALGPICPPAESVISLLSIRFPNSGFDGVIFELSLFLSLAFSLNGESCHGKVLYNMNKSYLYIVLEIIDRELDGHCLFAKTAIREGWTVVLGTKKAIFSKMSILPKGVFLIKSIVPGEYDIQKKIAENGHKIVCLDQEGLLQRKGNEYRIRFDQRSIDLVDLICVWGQVQYDDLFSSFPSTDPSKVAVIGSPRADYWIQVSKNIDKLGEGVTKKYWRKHGDYILFTTSFGNANHALGGGGQIQMLQAAVGDKLCTTLSENAKDRRELAEFLLPKYRRLLIGLAISLKNMKIVVRPHPSEGLEYWRKVERKYDNVVIETEGSPTWWITGSRCVIHYGSTISLEAALLGANVVTYVPSFPDEHLKYLHLYYPEAVSYVSDSVDGTISIVKSLVPNNDNTEIRQSRTTSVLAKLEEILVVRHDTTSSEIILGCLRDLKLPEETADLKKHYYSTFRNLKYEIKMRILWAIANIPILFKVLPKKYETSKYFYSYGKRKVYTMSVQDIVERMEVVQKFGTEFENGYFVNKIGSNLFEIGSRQ